MKKRKKRSFPLGVISAIIIIIVTWLAVHGEVDRRIQMQIYPQEYSDYVELYAEKYNVPTEIVYSIIHTESKFDSKARSSAGAIGLMQITPDTYDWLLYLRKEEKPGELDDVRINIDFGTYYLSYLYKKFGDYTTVFAAYNAGMNRVSSWLEDERYSQNGRLIKIPFAETENYIKKVNNTMVKYKQLYSK
ncbi:MAG: lytic transglycosylase domain-containing protein [Clostridia bacterium]|nr:lytic transglycosylase domain-containing protein [Clostridia bacterium]